MTEESRRGAFFEVAGPIPADAISRFITDVTGVATGSDIIAVPPPPQLIVPRPAVDPEVAVRFGRPATDIARGGDEELVLVPAANLTTITYATPYAILVVSSVARGWAVMGRFYARPDAVAIQLLDIVADAVEGPTVPFDPEQLPSDYIPWFNRRARRPRQEGLR